MSRSAGLAVLVALAVCAAGSCACAAESPATRPVVVLELFTSEGCSSCPPADVLLADVAKPDAVKGVQIIPLAMHVDYWNRLGWTDRFSSAQFSDRQEWYARIFQSDEVYTPQLIVDGTEPFVGSDKHAAATAIANAAARAMGRIAVDLAPDPRNADAVACGISIDGVHRDGAPAVDVMLAITEDDLSTDVQRGENAGHTLHHVAVVRALQRVAAIKSKDASPLSISTTVRLLPAWRTGRLHMVVFVQDLQTGRILAAGTERVPSGCDGK